MYKKYADQTIENKDKSTKTIVVQAICRKSDNAYIPFDEGNRDYQDYLAWVAEGNTAEAAD
tara:strand:- start:36 stop:218 length:183 start_codon:yes stop_codon:yes gene_type:complete